MVQAGIVLCGVEERDRRRHDPSCREGSAFCIKIILIPVDFLVKICYINVGGGINEIQRKNRCVALAFLDIELRSTTGIDLCRALLDVNPFTNVVYLTAYSEYAFDAWGTGASGFMLKPITPEGVREQLKNLRHPFRTGGAGK